MPRARSPLATEMAQRMLATAYDDIGAGANKCYAAHASVRARASALSWLSKGMAALSEGTARVNVAAGRAP